MSNWQTAKAFQDLITANCICFSVVASISLSHFSVSYAYLNRRNPDSLIMMRGWEEKEKNRRLYKMLQHLCSAYQGSPSWWVHYWCCCVWSPAAIAGILYDATTEKADDVPGRDLKSGTPQTTNVTASALQTLICKPVSQPLLSARLCALCVRL